MWLSNLDEWTQKYLIHCKTQKNLDAKTLKAYKIDLTQFSLFIKYSPVAPERELLQCYIAHLQEQYKIKSAKRKISSIKAFFSYLEYEEILDTNPMAKLRTKLHEPFLLPRTIPLKTISEILQYAYRQFNALPDQSYARKAALRNIAVLELLFATGMRVSELCNLTPDSVNPYDGTIKIYGKGSKERILQIGNSDVLSAVLRYYQQFHDCIESSGWFFVNRMGHRLSEQSVRNMINLHVSGAGIAQHITPHMFRHSFATLLLEEDVDIRYIQQLLGHSSITTTQIYTHVTLKKQRDILTTKHPRNKIPL